MYLKFDVIFPVNPTHSTSIFNPTEKILAILYMEVPLMLPAKYQPNRSSGSGEEVD